MGPAPKTTTSGLKPPTYEAWGFAETHVGAEAADLHMQTCGFRLMGG
jgi:hypothetical protein